MNDGNVSVKSKKGFASMSREEVRRIASLGGIAAHVKGTAHQFTVAEAREAGKKGGVIVSSNRAHMAEIGRKGGMNKNRKVKSEETEAPKQSR
jgi:uncharacterized protein